MRKYIIFPILIYLIVCIIAIILPAADGYNVVTWKLLVGQVYAIPILMISSFIAYFIYKRHHASH
ncbi:MAG TPA: DUF4017 family protein [Pseudogracilibacillus sp.]|nr:DUF4017 family protein [Pseudogracilibacillus sp.]